MTPGRFLSIRTSALPIYGNARAAGFAAQVEDELGAAAPRHPVGRQYAPTRTNDAQHLRPQIRQKHCAVGPRPNPRKFNDAQTDEGAASAR